MAINIQSNLPSKEEFFRYQSLVHRKLGITLPEHKRSMLGHRLFKRVRALNLTNFAQYYDFINHFENKAELNRALELITTNETFFFREEKHFDFLRDQILPNANANRTFKIWSAAASTGEEPYSIAMLMQHHYKTSWKLSASDVNNTVLAHARRGIYSEERTKFLPREYRQKFCMKGVDEYEGFMRVKPIIRNRVYYFNFNLLDSMASLEKVDLIFIRNVMIYFNDDTRQKIINNLEKVLNPNGWLFVSHSETLHGLNHSFALVKPAIYQLQSKD